MAWIERWRRWVMLSACLAGVGVAMAQDGPDAAHDAAAPHAINRTYVGQNLFIAQGQQIANATCVFCSMQVEGDVSGRVLVLFGNLSVTGRIGGSATVLDGNAVLDAQARVLGDTLVLFGNAVYESDDVLSGSAYVLGGHASSFAAREQQHRRFSLTRNALGILLVLGVGLLALLLVGVRQRRPHPTR